MTDALLVALNCEVGFLLALSFFQLKILIGIKQNGNGKGK